jgi:hypothetical protein
MLQEIRLEQVCVNCILIRLSILLFGIKFRLFKFIRANMTNVYGKLQLINKSIIKVGLQIKYCLELIVIIFTSNTINIYLPENMIYKVI